MDEFLIYLELGFHHILDIEGYDHILFLLTLALPFIISDWRKLAITVTAFTIGHSLTLFLVVADLLTVNSDWVEFLIPVTILLTGLYNLLKISSLFQVTSSNQSIQVLYVGALLFGLIHGMGFSNYLKSLLGSSSEIAKPLLAFNIGVELGQLLFLAFLMPFLWAIGITLKSNEQLAKRIILICTCFVAGYLAFERWPL